MSTAVIRKLIVRVETQTDGYREGMRRVQDQTRETTRHIEEAHKPLHTLTQTVLGLAKAYSVLRLANAAYTNGTKLLGNPQFQGANRLAQFRAVGIGGSTASAAMRLGFSAPTALAVGSKAANGSLALTAAAVSAKQFAKEVAPIAGRLTAIGSAAFALVSTAQFLTSCAAEAEAFDAKLKRIPQTIQQTAPTIGEAWSDMRRSIGREFNNSVFGDARKWAQRFGRDVGLMGTGIKDWIISGIHGFSDRAAGRDRTQGDIDRYREKNFELIESMKERKRAEDAAATAGKTGYNLAASLDGLRAQLVAIREGAGAFASYAAAREGANKADQLAIQYAYSLVSARRKEIELDDRLRADLKRNREAAASAGKSARERELAARAAEGLDPEAISRLRRNLKENDATTATNSIRDQIDALQQQAATFGMSADAAERWSASQKGANAALIEQHRLLSNQARARVAAETKRRSLASGAAATIEANMTPAERLAAREAELARQKRAGHLTDDQFDRAAKSARRDFFASQPDVPGRPAALERGTAAAFHASFGADRKQALDAEQLAQAKESVKLLRRQLDALKAISDGSETAVVQDF